MIDGEEKMSNLSKSTFENDYLFDFTTMSDVNDWYEVSDTVRSVGKSKATLGIFSYKEQSNALLFICT